VRVGGTDLGSIERCTIERVMRETNGNKEHASRKLGISRTQLYGRLRKYGLEAHADRSRDESRLSSATN